MSSSRGWSLTRLEKAVMFAWHDFALGPLILAQMVADYASPRAVMRPAADVKSESDARRSIDASAAFVPLAAPVPTSGTGSERDTSVRTLTVMTFNLMMDQMPDSWTADQSGKSDGGGPDAVECGSTRMARFCRFVASLGSPPDVLFLQEVTRSMAHFIAGDEWMASRYLASCPPDDPRLDPYGTWTLVRCSTAASWVRATASSVLLSGSHKRATVARLGASGELVLVNVHLSATRSLWLQRVVELRRLHTLFSEAKGDVILAGDWNMDEDYADFSFVPKSWVEAYDLASPPVPPSARIPTFDRYANRIANKLPVRMTFRSFFDRVFVQSMSIDVANAPTVHTDDSVQGISDHFPLSVQLIWRHSKQ